MPKSCHHVLWKLHFDSWDTNITRSNARQINMVLTFIKTKSGQDFDDKRDWYKISIWYCEISAWLIRNKHQECVHIPCGREHHIDAETQTVLWSTEKATQLGQSSILRAYIAISSKSKLSRQAHSRCSPPSPVHLTLIEERQDRVFLVLPWALPHTELSEITDINLDKKHKTSLTRHAPSHLNNALSELP